MGWAADEQPMSIISRPAVYLTFHPRWIIRARGMNIWIRHARESCCHPMIVTVRYLGVCGDCDGTIIFYDKIFVGVYDWKVVIICCRCEWKRSQATKAVHQDSRELPRCLSNVDTRSIHEYKVAIGRSWNILCWICTYVTFAKHLKRLIMPVRMPSSSIVHECYVARISSSDK